MPNTIAIDHTGVNPLHLVNEEQHSVTSLNHADIFYIVPFKGPFFANGLVVKALTNGTLLELVKDVDYTLATPFVEATHVVGKLLYWAISFMNPQITGRVFVTYQSLGGPFANERGVALANLATKLYNPRTITYSQITGITGPFTADKHVVDMGDITGYDAFVAIINGLASVVTPPAQIVINGAIDPRFQEHILDVNNAHKVTKAQVNLPLVENLPVVSASELMLQNPPRKYVTAELLHFRPTLNAPAVIDTLDVSALVQLQLGKLNGYAIQNCVLVVQHKSVLDSVWVSDTPLPASQNPIDHVITGLVASTTYMVRYHLIENGSTNIISRSPITNITTLAFVITAPPAAIFDFVGATLDNVNINADPAKVTYGVGEITCDAGPTSMVTGVIPSPSGYAPFSSMDAFTIFKPKQLNVALYATGIYTNSDNLIMGDVVLEPDGATGGVTLHSVTTLMGRQPVFNINGSETLIEVQGQNRTHTTSTTEILSRFSGSSPIPDPLVPGFTTIDPISGLAIDQGKYRMVSDIWGINPNGAKLILSDRIYIYGYTSLTCIMLEPDGSLPTNITSLNVFALAPTGQCTNAHSLRVGDNWLVWAGSDNNGPQNIIIRFRILADNTLGNLTQFNTIYHDAGGVLMYFAKTNVVGDNVYHYHSANWVAESFITLSISDLLLKLDANEQAIINDTTQPYTLISYTYLPIAPTAGGYYGGGIVVTDTKFYLIDINAVYSQLITPTGLDGVWVMEQTYNGLYGMWGNQKDCAVVVTNNSVWVFDMNRIHKANILPNGDLSALVDSDQSSYNKLDYLGAPTWASVNWGLGLSQSSVLMLRNSLMLCDSYGNIHEFKFDGWVGNGSIAGMGLVPTFTLDTNLVNLASVYKGGQTASVRFSASPVTTPTTIPALTTTFINGGFVKYTLPQVTGVGAYISVGMTLNTGDKLIEIYGSLN